MTNGNTRYPKEIFEVSGSGRTARLDNFRRATVWSGRRKRVARVLGAVDKGQAAQVIAFVDAVRAENGHADLGGFARRDHPGDARRGGESSERSAGATFELSAPRLVLGGAYGGCPPARWLGALRDTFGHAHVGPPPGAPGFTARPDHYTDRVHRFRPSSAPGTPDAVPEQAKDGLVRAAEAMLEGHLTLLGVERLGSFGTGLVLRPDHTKACSERRVRLPDRPPLRRR